jgi:disulfide bond formation protein DsbB
LPLAAALLAIGGVLLALYLQHGKSMYPCSWCVFQRLQYLVLAVLALVAWALRGRGGASRLFSGLALLMALGGIVAAMYQQLVAADDLSCALSLADRVVTGLHLDTLAPWLFQATAMCNEANLPMLGIPFAIWSAMLFGLLSLLLAWATFSRRGAA